jgi:hypothetical protein
MGTRHEAEGPATKRMRRTVLARTSHASARLFDRLWMALSPGCSAVGMSRWKWQDKVSRAMHRQDSSVNSDRKTCPAWLGPQQAMSS